MPTDDAITVARSAFKLRNQLEYRPSGRCLTGRRPSLLGTSQPQSLEAMQDAMKHLSVNRSGNPQHVRRNPASQQDSEATPASPSAAETERSPARASQGRWLCIQEAQLASEFADEKLADEKRADEKRVSFRVEPKDEADSPNSGTPGTSVGDVQTRRRRCTRMATTSRVTLLASSNSKKGDKVIDIKQRSIATLSKGQKRAMKSFKDRQRSGGPAMAGWSGASKLELDVGDTVTTVAISEDNTLFAVGSTNKKATVYAARSPMPIEPAIR